MVLFSSEIKEKEIECKQSLIETKCKQLPVEIWSIILNILYDEKVYFFPRLKYSNIPNSIKYSCKLLYEESSNIERNRFYTFLEIWNESWK